MDLEKVEKIIQLVTKPIQTVALYEATTGEIVCLVEYSNPIWPGEFRVKFELDRRELFKGGELNQNYLSASLKNAMETMRK